jgi:hypothetical protein
MIRRRIRRMIRRKRRKRRRIRRKRTSTCYRSCATFGDTKSVSPIRATSPKIQRYVRVWKQPSPKKKIPPLR